VFQGQFKHTIDPKGRVSIPAKFREALSEHGDDVVILPYDNALEVHPHHLWQALRDKVKALPVFDPDRRALTYRYLSRGLDVKIDPQGRLQVPQDYRERVGLQKDVCIIGLEDRFEVWDVERWAHFEREQGGPLNDVFARLALKGI
jgi:MraZ protein